MSRFKKVDDGDGAQGRSQSSDSNGSLKDKSELKGANEDNPALQNERGVNVSESELNNTGDEADQTVQINDGVDQFGKMKTK